jgi:selenoprotein W-related protein
LTVELLQALESEIETITLQPSDGGRFEVTVNGHLLYSKQQTARHPQAGEVLGLVRNLIQKS